MISLHQKLKTGLFILIVSLFPTQPANAFFPVFDVNNFGQNLINAARNLEQINNQITQLHNQTQMIVNQVKNLANLPTSIANDLQNSLGQMDNLVRNARNVSYQINEIDSYFNRVFPEQYAAATSSSQIFQDGQEAWNTARQGFQHSMQVQARVIEQVRLDANVLDGLVTQSQAAIGNLQVAQAGNQLSALNAKQTMQLQTLLAASARADALNQAAELAIREQGQAHFQNFLGDQSAYTP